MRARRLTARHIDIFITADCGLELAVMSLFLFPLSEVCPCFSFIVMQMLRHVCAGHI